MYSIGMRREAQMAEQSIPNRQAVGSSPARRVVEGYRLALRLPRTHAKRWAKLAARTGETLSAWLRRLAYEAEERARADLERR